MSPQSKEHANGPTQGPLVWVARLVILALIVVCLAIGDFVLVAILAVGWIVSEVVRARQLRRQATSGPPAAG